MKKYQILINILFFLFFGCFEKEERNVDSDKIKNDSLNVLMSAVNNKKISESERIKNVDKAYSLIKDSKSTLDNRDTLFSIVYRYYLAKEWKKFDHSSIKLLEVSKKNQDMDNVVKVYRYRANYFKRTEVFDSSYYYYIKAEKIYSKLDDGVNLANILYNKGIVQYSVSDYLGAELSLTKAYSIFKFSEEYDKLYGTLNQLGLVFNELREYDKSFFYHNKALEAVKQFKLQNEEHQEAVCYNNIGYLFIKQKKYNKAVEYFKKGLLDKGILKDDPELYASLMDNLAYSSYKSRNGDDSEYYFTEALRIRKILNKQTLIVGSYIHLSEFYQDKGDSFNSIHFSHKAVEIAKKSKIPQNIALALKQASIVDKENASKYSDDYIRISDSLQIAERNSKDRFTKIQFETEEVKKENTVLTNQNIATKRNVVIATIIGLLFVLFRYLKIRERVRDLKQASQLANEEILKLIISQQNQVDEGKEIEKKRMSKELHDGVLGKLFGLRLNLDGLNMYDDEDSKKIRANYINELKNIEQDIREISHELSREHVAIINNFEAILNNLLYEQSKINKAKLNITISEKIDWEIIPNITKINLYRILQEGLQNINKYASAETINVNFEIKEEKNLYFSLEDDGIGYDAKNKRINGIGMKNMVQRAQQSKGNIEFKSEIGKGSKIIITFPLEIKV